MTNEREGMNRKIAIFFMHWFEPTNDETSEALRDRRHDLRNWTLHRTSGAPIELFSSYYWTPPDFFLSEQMNAMVLEKMPYPKVLFDRKAGEWTCESDWRFFHNGVTHADRKTAICLAALALIEKESK